MKLKLLHLGQMLFLGSVLGVVSFAADVSAQILTGKVTNTNAIGVANVQLDFFETSTGTPVVLAGNITDANGNYGVLLPANGIYDVEFVTPVIPGGITPVRYAALNITGTVILNVTRPFGKVLTGWVRDSLGALILTKDIDLDVSDALTGVLEFTPNDNSRSDGHYAVIISPGLKTLGFAPTVVGSRHAAVSFRNVNILNDTAIDASMPAGVVVSGRILDQSSQPARNVDLDFDSSATKVRITTPNDNTDNNGDYIVTVPRGVYDITIEPQVADRLVGQRRYLIPINRDTVIDWSVQTGWSLSGTVTQLSGGAPVQTCDIDVVDTISVPPVKLVTPGDKTSAAGFYEVVVPAGFFDLHYQPPVSTHLASVNLHAIHIGQDTVVNVTLPSGILLNGTITSGSGALVDGADIDALNSASKATVLAAGDKTNFFGQYAMVLPSAIYDLEFEAPKSRRLQAKKLLNQAVVSDRTLSVVLDTGLSVSGIIRAGVGGPVVDSVDVDALIQSTWTNTFQPGDMSDSLGAYQIIIGFVSHTLIFRPLVSTRLAAQSITVASPGADQLRDVNLVSGFRVSGTVTGPTSAPAAGVELRADAGVVWVPTSDGISQASGAYETILSAGTYKLQYFPPAGSGLGTLELPSVNITKDTIINVQLPVSTCNCPYQGDINADLSIDVFDVIGAIGIAFSGDSDTRDPACPKNRGDVNNDGATDVFDVIYLIAAAFSGGPNPVDPCNP